MLVDLNGCETDIAPDVAKSNSYTEFNKSPEGRAYISQFEEGGIYQDQLLKVSYRITQKSDGSKIAGTHRTGYFTDDTKKSFIQTDKIPDGKQIVQLVTINSKCGSDSPAKGFSFLRRCDTIMEEIQHANCNAYFGKDTAEEQIYSYNNVEYKRTFLEGVNNRNLLNVNNATIKTLYMPPKVFGPDNTDAFDSLLPGKMLYNNTKPKK